MSAKKKASKKPKPGAIERSVKREEQKQQGALDGRFREKVVPSKKRYDRKRTNDPPPQEE